MTTRYPAPTQHASDEGDSDEGASDGGATPDGLASAEAAAHQDQAGRWVAAMRAPDFAAAWRIADDVLAARDPAARDDPRQPYHLRWVWDGTPPDGRDVLVRCYHGLGDTIQFARFLPALRRRAARVTLEAPSALVALFENLPGVDRLLPFDPDTPQSPSGCDVEIMELAHMLRVCPQDAADCVPYLAHSRDQVPCAVAPGAVALCWQAGDWDRARSVPLPLLLGACVGSGRRLISLQRGPAASEATDPAFLNPGDTDTDLRHTTGLASAARLIVTVDTMVAHLAGALGRPGVLLLKYDADWRWPGSGQTSPWYPTLTILRQQSPRQWNRPLQQLADLLKQVRSSEIT